MGSWGQLVAQLGAVPEPQRGAWLSGQLGSALRDVARLREQRNVILWGSAFLQKSILPGPFVSITGEDLNGFMSVIHGMDCSRGLTLVLHTPGGEIGAAETVVSYLRSKFDHIEVIVPTFAMSAGTMISLAAERVVMGRQSQLGPIDPQIQVGGRFLSAGEIVAQYEQAVSEIVGDPANNKPGDLQMAHVWAPILSSLGPGLLTQARYILGYGETMVAEWLVTGMFEARQDPRGDASRVAHYFADASEHRYHGRRIGRDEARDKGVVVEELEANQELQEAVLTAYHIMTMIFDNSPAAKIIAADGGSLWLRNIQMGPPPPVPPQPPQAPQAPQEPQTQNRASRRDRRNRN